MMNKTDFFLFFEG